MNPTLSIYDYLVVGFYFVFMTFIGWIFRKFVTNTSDYFRGGGQMTWWMTGAGAFMVQFSAWTFTGAASKAYQDGAIIMVIFFANSLGFFINFLYFAPRFRQMRVVTSMEAVRHRFGKANEQFFTWLQIPLGILYAAIWLNGLCVFVSAAFGWDVQNTTWIVGIVVVLIAVFGGSWAVVASDFMQTLILMPVTIVGAFLALNYVGGWDQFVDRLPTRFFNLTAVERPGLIYLWIIAISIKQFVSTNNMLEASRYLTAKDSRHARKAALLGAILFIVGPIVWFIPPMAAAIVVPDLKALFPQLKNPSEGAFVAMCLKTMPAGMIGLIISGIFAATMSSMDGGLNRNAGFFVKNFYQIMLRPKAHDRELLLAGKITTLISGILVIFASLTFSSWSKVALFDLMLRFGTLVALPYSMPLIWGTLIKKAPAWSGWSTVLVGFATSLCCENILHAAWLQNFMGWDESLSSREQSDWAIIIGVLLNVIVCSLWFFGTCLFHAQRSAQEQEQTAKFFERLETPVNFEREIGAGSDAKQSHTLGLLCIAYGLFVLLMVLIPNPWLGRMAILFCAVSLLGVGVILYLSSRRLRNLVPSNIASDLPTDSRTLEKK